ncbi:apoptosis-stimulating of p53 protein 1-like isoform X2 [Liolophura sinensis]|uniref:apoptosis-stimulating of p53 protein 1-like isoform X2 n=1 Tax=Liolophura sinensis TaxID=3198878 RepID=UPI003159852F
MSHNNVRFQSELPAGSELSLTELQDIASRQQLQIDNQQQVLVAKEQRLKYLKQQEMKHQQMSAENERLRKLKEKVESQEMKLKKLRAVRGQVEQYKINNNSLTSELEGIKSLFNEKEKELAMAVAKVEELTTQLESLRAGKASSMNNNTSLASIELEKLRKELILRNKLNEQQSVKIVANRDLLQQRKGEILQIDQRISDLQQRLKKKKAQNASGHNSSQNYNDNFMHSRQTTGNHNGTNIAAIEPYMKQPPKDVTKDDLHTNFGFDRQDPKNQTLPPNLKFPHPEKSKGLEIRSDHMTSDPNSNASVVSKNYAVPLVVKVNNSKSPPNGDHAPVNTEKIPPPKDTDDARVTATSAMKYAGSGTKVGMGIVNLAPKPFGSTYSTSMLTGRPFVSTSSQPTANIQDEVRTGGSGQSSPATSDNSYPVSNSAQPVLTGQNQGTMPHKTGLALNSKPMYNTAKFSHVGPTQSGASSGPKVTAPVPSRDIKPTPLVSKNGNHASSSAEVIVPSIPPRQTPTSTFPSSKHPMQTPLPRPSQKVSVAQPTTSSGSNVSSNNTAASSHSKIVSALSSSSSKPGHSPVEQPISASSRWPKTAVTSASITSQDNSDHGRMHSTNTAHTTSIQGENGGAGMQVGTAAGVVQPAKGIPRYAPKSVIANTYTQKLGSGAIEQYRKNMSMLYQGFGDRNKKQDNSATGSSDGVKSTSMKPSGPESQAASSPTDVTDSRLNSTSSLSQYASDKPSFKATSPKHLRRRHSDSSDNEEAQTKLLQTQPSQTVSPPKPSAPSSVGQTENKWTAEESSGAEAILVIDNLGNVLEMSDSADLSVTSAQNEMFGEPGEQGTHPKAPIVIETNKVKHRLKTNLKEKSSSNRSSNKRVSFDPLALLLDASLEGELELVRKTATEVADVSASNDEGITALHNAICAGHYEIVKFLVEFGADANAPDSDGWTPLHCAASCNNLPMVKLLVDHGACIFATTISDQETAAEKCEEDEDGYDGCSEYLYSIQEKLGIINNGVVFAVFDYKSQNSDELSFRVNSLMTILRKGDEKEKEWWWARIRDREGYVPRNLLGLSRRVLSEKGKIEKK